MKYLLITLFLIPLPCYAEKFYKPIPAASEYDEYMDELREQTELLREQNEILERQERQRAFDRSTEIINQRYEEEQRQREKAEWEYQEVIRYRND